MNPLNWFLSKLVEIPAAVILTPIVGISFAFLSLGNVLLVWMVNVTLDPTWSLTSPANNDLIKAGWGLTRDLANIGVILGLVFIGIATALRLAEFKTQKAFAMLLIVALFINFTPLICGIVVDASYFVSKFFLQEGVGDWGMLAAFGEQWWSTLTATFAGTVPLAGLVKHIILILYGFIGGFTLIVFALLFLVRTIAIQILVILSPIAFFCLIFEQTKKIFDGWWQQLISWSFITAVGGFFLYLAHHASKAILANPIIGSAVPKTSPEATFFGTIASHFTIVIFLLIALIATLKSNAIGVGQLSGYAKKYGGMGLKMVGWGIARNLGRGIFGAAYGAKKGSEIGYQWGKERGGRPGAIAGGLLGGFSGMFGGGTYWGLPKEARQEALEESARFRLGLTEKTYNIGEKLGFLPSEGYAKKIRENAKKEAEKITNKSFEWSQGMLDKPGLPLSSQVANFERLADKGMVPQKNFPNFTNLAQQGFISPASFKSQFEYRPDLITGSVIAALKKSQKEFIKNINPKNFVEKAVPQSLNPDVVIHMSGAHLRGFDKEGSPEQLENITQSIKSIQSKVEKTPEETLFVQRFRAVLPTLSDELKQEFAPPKIIYPPK